MRKLMLGGLVLLLLIGGLLAFAASNLNSLVEANKDRLLAQAEQALGRPLQIGDIELSLWGGIGARLQNVALADDPAFSSETFVRAADLQITLKLMPLLRQELEVGRVIVRDPVIRLIRNAEGVFNFASLGRGQTQVTSPQDSGGTQAVPPQASEAAPASGTEGLPLLVALANIANGDIHYTDRQTRTELRLSQIDLEVENLSLDQPLSLELSAAFLAEQQNLRVSGSFGPLGPEVQVEQLAVDASLSLDPLDSVALGQALPQVAETLPPGLGLSGPLRLSSRVSGTAAALMVSDVRLTASVFESDQANLRVTGEVGPLGADMAALRLSGDIGLGPFALPRLLRFDPLAAHLPPELKVEGPATVTLRAEGGLDDLALTATVEATDSALAFGDRFRKPRATPLVITTEARLMPERVDLQEAKIQLHTLALTASGEVSLGNRPNLDLRLDSNRVDLAGWSGIVPELHALSAAGQMELHCRIKGQISEERWPDVTGTFDLHQASASLAQLPQPLTALNASIRLTGQGASIQNASARIGRSTLAFAADLARLRPVDARYSLSSPELWLADVLTDGQAASDVLSSLKTEGRLRLEGGRLALGATLSSAQGRLAAVDYTDLQAELSLSDQVARLERLSVHTLGGSIVASGRYDTAASPPRLRLASQVSNIELAELFRVSLPGASDSAHGTADFSLELTGSGRDWAALKPSLDGRGELEIKDGALTDINIADEVLRQVTGIPGLTNFVSPRVRQKYPALFSRRDTEFLQLGGRLRLSQGRILLDDVQLAAADYTTQGQGWLDYDQTVDFQGQLILAEELSQDIQDGVRLASLLSNDQGRIALPFALRGSLPGAKPVPDITAIARRVQHGLVTQGVEALQDKVLNKLLPPTATRDGGTQDGRDDAPADPVRPEDVLREGLQEGLRGLFGR